MAVELYLQLYPLFSTFSDLESVKRFFENPITISQPSVKPCQRSSNA